MITILYRMVGGFIGLGPSMTFLTRVRWAVPMGCLLSYAGIVRFLEPWQVLVVLVGTCLTAYLGRLIPHARFQATASLKNSLGMSAVGVARMALLMAPMGYFQPQVMVLSAFGLFQGVAYYLGWTKLHGKDSGIYFRNKTTQWRIADNTTSVLSDPNDILDQAAVGGSEWGELLTGLLVYELAYIALLVMP